MLSSCDCVAVNSERLGLKVFCLFAKKKNCVVDIVLLSLVAKFRCEKSVEWRVREGKFLRRDIVHVVFTHTAIYE